MKLSYFSMLALSGAKYVTANPNPNPEAESAPESNAPADATNVIDPNNFVSTEGQNSFDSTSDKDALSQMLLASCKTENNEVDQACVDRINELIGVENGSIVMSKSDGDIGRKLKQLKVLILWLQPEHRFARYCFYGCWCLPDADHKLFTVGYGKPVDNIDASCKRQSQCYDCAVMDHSDRVCDASTMGYNYKLHFDPADPTNHWKKSIECTDRADKGSKGSCRRSICECDKKLSEDLREHFQEWYLGHHQEQGTFDSGASCIVEGCKNGNCGGGSEIHCCGFLGSGVRMPYKSSNGRRKCCGDKTYDSGFQECCDGNILAATGTC
jgi:hypothetical protein